MATQLPYTVHYLPPSQQSHYLIAPHPQHAHIPGHVHLASTQMRPEQPQRKRPKYTRSKTGCLTCRGKKIKCDETKPKCQRCTHGQRECTWPEVAPSKKRPPVRRGSNQQERPSTADSTSRVSESSSTSRDITPNTRELEGGVVPVPGTERRYSESQAHSYALPSPPTGRRQTLPHIGHSQLPHTIPSSSFGSLGNYSPPYQTSMLNSYSVAHSSAESISSRSNSRPSTANSIPPTRLSNHALDTSHYNTPSMLQSLEPRDAYRWEALPPRSNPYGYSSATPDDMMSRHYSR